MEKCSLQKSDNARVMLIFSVGFDEDWQCKVSTKQCPELQKLVRGSVRAFKSYCRMDLGQLTELL